MLLGGANLLKKWTKENLVLRVVVVCFLELCFLLIVTQLPFPGCLGAPEGGEQEGTLKHSAQPKLTQLWDYYYRILCGPVALPFLHIVMAFQISFIVGAWMYIGSIGRSLCLLVLYVMGLVELACLAVLQSAPSILFSVLLPQ